MPFRSVRAARKVLFIGIVLAGCAAYAAGTMQNTARTIPRTSDGKPDLQGIWKMAETAANNDVTPYVDGKNIPYRPDAAARKAENAKNQKTADPLESCFMPGVPRIMYLDYPFQIFQTRDHVAMTFQWSQVYRLIYMHGKPPMHAGIESWMGDSRGRWEGDTLVIDVTEVHDRPWFDKAGNYHSDEVRMVERLNMTDPDTIQYEITVTDAKVFTAPWKIKTTLQRQKGLPRLLEFQCQAEKEEANGAFERDPKTWYPK